MVGFFAYMLALLQHLVDLIFFYMGCAKLCNSLFRPILLQQLSFYASFLSSNLGLFSFCISLNALYVLLPFFILWFCMDTLDWTWSGYLLVGLLIQVRHIVQFRILTFLLISFCSFKNRKSLEIWLDLEPCLLISRWRWFLNVTVLLLWLHEDDITIGFKVFGQNWDENGATKF